uniref:HotDog ACOT-type domain-containing protein n=1 Tax=Gadus morhua TaxID=8049 RepID=A0A8C5A5U5_GADMO
MTRRSAIKEEEEEEEEEEEVNPTEVKMSQIVMPSHSNHRQELSVGQLLKWMDSTACLSAEKHAGCSCVTASIDDIYFDQTISVGQVVNIKAKVNRAFNTSMEVGIVVVCEDLFTDRRWRVCHAFATFVTQRSASGIKLSPLRPGSQQQQEEHSLAAERRRMRRVHDDIIKDLLSDRTFQQAGGVVAAEKTRVESVELVLPPHANHQVNTFGGQIMAWMVNVATIAASRLCHAHPSLRSIDMFTFRGPSQVGDRLLLRAIVNNAFRTSMEVGVQAEAYRGGGPNRHINSAFMTFEVPDAHGNPRTLPRIRPEPLHGERRFQEAIARKKIRLDRKYIISCKQAEVPLSVPWNPSNQVYLSYNNVSALKMLAARNNWQLNSKEDQVCLYTLEEQGSLSFRVEAELDVSAQRAFRLLGDLRNRTHWDRHYLECDLIRSADKDDFLYRVVAPSVDPAPGGSANQDAGVLQEFILLASRRRPCGPGYYNQASPEVLPYISTDIAGLSSSFYRSFCCCRQYLTQNCLGPGDQDQDPEQDQDQDCSSLDYVTLL